MGQTISFNNQSPHLARPNEPDISPNLAYSDHDMKVIILGW